MKLYKYTYEGLLKLMNEDFCKREGLVVQLSSLCLLYHLCRWRELLVQSVYLTLPKSVHVYHDSL